MTEFKSALIILVLFAFITGCKQSPDATKPVSLEKMHAAEANRDVIDRNVHKVEILEVKPTSKYVYLKVTDQDREYWMATGNKEITKGDTYFYNEALLMTQFESKEMQKVFDTLYLVTQLLPESQAEKLKSVTNEASATTPENLEPTGEHHTSGIYRDAEKMTIGELLSNPGAYEGKMVEVHGECTKINTGIMGRNWIHLQDVDETENKVVVTSQWVAVPGEEVSFRALVSLNKDFGAGYSYEVLLEEGIMVK
ncbi:GW dipeptide domain-containing protein [Lentiprolixibacter aurantiacus]|uniref:GW dipeptide domain-containing protein n=1 Tax=Lentiprolixibacter aurantiacus TaxID=2993939 RepID=A0AAE3MNC8_9FLAO|nr:GW dipeptide domain-containing protein [Lentiprolixibacter aurantiacus]MCX2720383.1 GW dipeptide domain-containing protein [Lentiprolixibacter aurantiacus]